MKYLIYCKNFCKCHNVPVPRKTIRRLWGEENYRKRTFSSWNCVFESVTSLSTHRYGFLPWIRSHQSRSAASYQCVTSTLTMSFLCPTIIQTAALISSCQSADSVPESEGTAKCEICTSPCPHMAGRLNKQNRKRRCFGGAW
jgi:hypothetical protein